MRNNRLKLYFDFKFPFWNKKNFIFCHCQNNFHQIFLNYVLDLKIEDNFCLSLFKLLDAIEKNPALKELMILWVRTSKTKSLKQVSVTGVPVKYSFRRSFHKQVKAAVNWSWVTCLFTMDPLAFKNKNKYYIILFFFLKKTWRET